AAPANPVLLETLKAWRRETAQAAGMPAFVVLHDSSLEALCHCPPRTLPELRQITGFGDRKVALYGEAIVALTARHAALD
ncbi:MAG: HRDC domain-containing protein, partial [Terriglobales bacterium]